MLLLALIASHSNCYAQNESKQPSDTIKFKNAIGAGAGITTGFGLSYRYIPRKCGVQINFSPIKNNFETTVSVGLTLIHYLLENDKTNLYLYLGNCYLYESLQQTDSIGKVIQGKEEKSYVNNGIGIGMEIIILKRISLNLMGGYASINSFKELGFTGETGLYYKF